MSEPPVTRFTFDYDAHERAILQREAEAWLRISKLLAELRRDAEELAAWLKRSTSSSK